MNAHSTGIHTEDEVDRIMTSDSAVAVNEYLTLMEDTESPRKFLIWSLLAMVAGLIGRNAEFTSGPNHTVTPNLFVVLLGPAGVRKSTAVNFAAKLCAETSLNLGPTDTGGQRHGIMSALTGLHRQLNRGIRPTDQALIPPTNLAMIRPRAANDMMLVAPELGRLMGVSSREMADFMVDLWDGAAIDYQTKAGETKLSGTLVSLLGATTPSSLASILPDNATGHGILSRIIFVYDDRKYKDVPLPPTQPEEWYESRESFQQRLHWIDNNRTNFGLHSGAREAFTRLYTFVPGIQDPRLEHYKERRPTMLIKVAMCLAALRSDTMVIESDMLLAHELLNSIEPTMHRALEHFGRNKVFQGRMLILQFLRSAGSTNATRPELVAAAASELNNKEANEAIDSMLASGELYAYGEVIMLGTAKNELLKKKPT